MDVINILFKPRPLGVSFADLGSLPGYQLLFHIEPRLRQQLRACDRLHLSADQLARAELLVTELERELREYVPGHHVTALALLMQLIVYLARCYAPPAPPDRERSHRLGEVLSHLDRHYREPVTVDQLTQLGHMSRSTLMRQFQLVFQCSPIDYLIRLRIQKACELLGDRELRIADIARACGFNDGNYFARQFARVMGGPPREHRRNLRAHAPGRGTIL